MTMVDRLYLTHSNRGENGCPACGQFIVWRKIGDRKWVPCDKTPVICVQEDGATFRVVKHGELLQNVRIINKNNLSKMVGKKWFYALQPHVFTCPEIPRGRNFD